MPSLTVSQAITGYMNVYGISWTKAELMYEPYPEAISRALFIPPHLVETARLGMAKYDPVRRTSAKPCTAQDVRTGADFIDEPNSNQSPYWRAECRFYAGNFSDCGSAAEYRRPICRSVRVHFSIWEDEALRTKVTKALLEPCHYLRGEKFSQHVFGSSLADLKETRSATHDLIQRKLDWAGCTELMPKPTEIIVNVTGSSPISRDYRVKITDKTSTL